MGSTSPSTISVALSEALATAHAKAGQRFVAAPAFGRPTSLREVSCSSLRRICGRARRGNSFSSMRSDRKLSLSPRPAKGPRIVKLASGNFFDRRRRIQLLGEAMALVDKGGVGRHHYLDYPNFLLSAHLIYKTYGALIADTKFFMPASRHPLARRTSVSPSRRPKSCVIHHRLPASWRDRFLTQWPMEAMSSIGRLSADSAAKDAGEEG